MTSSSLYADHDNSDRIDQFSHLTYDHRHNFNRFNRVFIQMYSRPISEYFVYDFYHKFLSGTPLVYPRRVKTGVGPKSTTVVNVS